MPLRVTGVTDLDVGPLPGRCSPSRRMDADVERAVSLVRFRPLSTLYRRRADALSRSDSWSMPPRRRCSDRRPRMSRSVDVTAVRYRAATVPVDSRRSASEPRHDRSVNAVVSPLFCRYAIRRPPSVVLASAKFTPVQRDVRRDEAGAAVGDVLDRSAGTSSRAAVPVTVRPTDDPVLFSTMPLARRWPRCCGTPARRRRSSCWRR